MPANNLDIIVKLRDAASKGLTTLKTNLATLDDSAAKSTKGMQNLYASFVAIAGVVAGGALFGKSIKDFADFDDNMRAAGAVTKATAQELEAMTLQAERMGKETRYTASNAAEALKFLGMAGFNAADSTAALPGVMQLAAAGALDLGTAADIATNVLSGFGLKVENLSRVNDVLVQTFTSSNVNMTEIGEAFKYVGPIAASVGGDFEDLVGSIGALGNAGIKGSQAGTYLKGAISALLAPTAQEAELMDKFAQRIGQAHLNVKDANGDFVGFVEIIRQLEKAGLRGEEALQAFSERAGVGLAALINMGSNSLAELIEKLREAGGVSKEIADKMEAGLGGQLRETESVLEAFRLKLGEIFGPEIIDILTSFRNWIGYITDQLIELKKSGDLAGWGKGVVEIMDFIGESLKRVHSALSALVSLSMAFAGAITGNFDFAKAAIQGYLDDIGKLFGSKKEDLANEAGTVTKAITQEMYDELNAATKDTGPIGRAVNKAADKMKNFVPSASVESRLKASLVKLTAILKTESEKIESEYDRGLITIEEYFTKRESIVKRQIEAELAILRQAAKSETDVSKREIINAQIFAKEESLNSSLIALANERYEEERKIDEKRTRREEQIASLKLKAEQAYINQQARIRVEGQSDFELGLQNELAGLQDKHLKELEEIKKYNAALLEEKKKRHASEQELEYADQEAKALISRQQALQAQETAQLIQDQQMRLSLFQLDNLKTIASGTAAIFTDLYNITGKKSKEFFYLAKAAAIAEATMNVAQGITKAMATGGWLGIAQGTMIAAQGAIQIAKIMGQNLAEGGIVKGHSPNSKADNIKANLTANEFVQPVSAVKEFGLDFMEKIRTGAPTSQIISSLMRRGDFSGFRMPVRTGSGSNYAIGGLVGDAAKENTEKSSVNVTMLNVADPRELDRYMASVDGQNAVLNVISSRSSEVKRIIRG